jgi:4-alpha-glucanotransferase
MASPDRAWVRPGYEQAIHAALRALGKTHLVLAVHDVSLPAADDDLGRGSLYSEAGRGFLRFARALGFTGVQLGPQGRTTPANASPYDSMMFSRDPPALSFAQLLPAANLRPLTGDVGEKSDPAGAHARAERALATLTATGKFANEADEFAQANAAWLARDATYAALAAEFGGEDWRAWPANIDVTDIVSRQKNVISRYRLAQMLLARQHEATHAYARSLGLKLYGDMQIGISHQDSYWLRPLFLAGYKMGAPPSRTNPEGQPWNYPVFDPAHHAGEAGVLGELRADRMLAMYDGLRIDHPHGLVDAWVYRDDDARGPLAAVQSGARLFSSPDLPDHPRLQAFAIARPDELDRALPRHHDDWVRTLDAAQVSRYAVLFNRILARVHARGRDNDDLMCEVLSTWPYPLRRVMNREDLGRLVVTQKAAVDDPRDVYRSDNAGARDWIMVGNHDTQPIRRVVERWRGTAEAEKRAQFLSERLHVANEERNDFVRTLMTSEGEMVNAMFAELFASRASHVSIFFADVFGYRDIYNAPGTVSDENWRLRIARNYEDRYANDMNDLDALNLPRALILALESQQPRNESLIRELQQFTQ